MPRSPAAVLAVLPWETVLSQAWWHRIGSQLSGRIKSSRAAGAVE